MALVVEDGTGLANAESLCSIAFAEAYHVARGNLAWSALQSIPMEHALRKATQYMAQAYRQRWAGVRINNTQALDWPRYNVPKRDGPGTGAWMAYYPIDAVPTEVQQACAELALKASADDLNPDLTRGVLKETVGQLSVEYDPNSPQQIRYRAIDQLLAPLFKHGGGINVVRA